MCESANNVIKSPSEISSRKNFKVSTSRLVFTRLDEDVYMDVFNVSTPYLTLEMSTLITVIEQINILNYKVASSFTDCQLQITQLQNLLLVPKCLGSFLEKGLMNDQYSTLTNTCRKCIYFKIYMCLVGCGKPKRKYN